MKETLLLNASGEPLRVISWQRAISLAMRGKVEVLERYESLLRSAHHSYVMPAVVRLRVYQRQPRGVAFSRYNVFRRDQFTCQYCGAQPGLSALTFDHVVPRARGGGTHWANIVTACGACNNRKADRSLEASKMHLARWPAAPDHLPLVSPAEAPHASWAEYLVR